jgi:hypothetical protein
VLDSSRLVFGVLILNTRVTDNLLTKLNSLTFALLCNSIINLSEMKLGLPHPPSTISSQYKRKSPASPIPMRKCPLRGITFNQDWVLEFALEITYRDPVSLNVIYADCKLCRLLGRDEKSRNTDGTEPKRVRTDTVITYSSPWRHDNMRRHLKQQHARTWTLYQKMSFEDKQAFILLGNLHSMDNVDIPPTLQVKSSAYLR